MDDAFRLKWNQCKSLLGFSSSPIHMYVCVCVCACEYVFRGAGNLYVWKRLDGDIFLMLRSNRITCTIHDNDTILTQACSLWIIFLHFSGFGFCYAANVIFHASSPCLAVDLPFAVATHQLSFISIFWCNQKARILSACAPQAQKNKSHTVHQSLDILMMRYLF